MDVVEHAPVAGLSAPDFLVAKLIYKIIGYWGAATSEKKRHDAGLHHGAHNQ